jgi:hypothetical protein
MRRSSVLILPLQLVFRACTIKLYCRYVAVTLKARVFANVRHFHPSLTFGAKLTLVSSSTPVSSSLACKN